MLLFAFSFFDQVLGLILLVRNTILHAKLTHTILIANNSDAPFVKFIFP